MLDTNLFNLFEKALINKGFASIEILHVFFKRTKKQQKNEKKAIFIKKWGYFFS